MTAGQRSCEMKRRRYYRKESRLCNDRKCATTKENIGDEAGRKIFNDETRQICMFPKSGQANEFQESIKDSMISLGLLSFRHRVLKKKQ